MKKFFIIAALFALSASSCSLLTLTESEHTPLPPTPTPTPDPCSPENIISEVEDLQAIVNSFQDGTIIANNTDVNQIIFPLMRLQEIQTEIRKIKVPDCLETLKNTSLEYTSSVINYLLIFMNIRDPESEELNASVQNSQIIWQSVLKEFNNVLATAGMEPQQLPELNQLFPQGESLGAVVSNTGTQAVNIRSAPNLDASIVASLEAGMQAPALGRTEAGDWIQVNLEGVLGWVFAETVTINVPIENLPVVEAVP